jgi:hypothetical protein
MYASTGDFFLTSAIEMMKSNSSEYMRLGEAVADGVHGARGAELLRVREHVLMARECDVFGAERVAVNDPVVAQRSAISTCGAVWAEDARVRRRR